MSLSREKVPPQKHLACTYQAFYVCILQELRLQNKVRLRQPSCAPTTTNATTGSVSALAQNQWLPHFTLLPLDLPGTSFSQLLPDFCLFSSHCTDTPEKGRRLSLQGNRAEALRSMGQTPEPPLLKGRTLRLSDPRTPGQGLQKKQGERLTGNRAAEQGLGQEHMTRLENFPLWEYLPGRCRLPASKDPELWVTSETASEPLLINSWF